VDIKQEIEKLLQEIITQPELFVVDITLGTYNKSIKIAITLDGDEGVMIDQCVSVSRKLGNKMEELELMADPYILEVSSPGLDKPLLLQRQYPRNIGRKIKVVTKDAITYTGELTNVEPTFITVLDEKKIKSKVLTNLVEIPFDNIKSTTVIISFN
jgi:ribosome maturation factor RimP